MFRTWLIRDSGNAGYNVSKAAVKAFTEQRELRTSSLIYGRESKLIGQSRMS